LVGASAFDDQLDAVAGDVCFERGGHGGPHVGASVGDVFRDGKDGHHIGRGTPEQEESHPVYVRIEVSFWQVWKCGIKRT
jgi:hypothetical protein